MKVGDLIYHEADVIDGILKAGVVVSIDNPDEIAVVFLDSIHQTEYHEPETLLSGDEALSEF